MPELPEVETVARQLAPHLVGQTARRLEILDPMLRQGTRPRIAGRPIEGVFRVGKRVVVRFGAGRGNDRPLDAPTQVHGEHAGESVHRPL